MKYYSKSKFNIYHFRLFYVIKETMYLPYDGTLFHDEAPLNFTHSASKY